MVKGHDGVVRKLFPGWSGRIKVDKTRINANEGKEVLLPFTHGKGFDSKISTINSAFGLEIIKKAGAFYSYEHLPEGKVRGKDNVIKFLMENQEAFDKLNQDVLTAVSSHMEAVVEEDSTEENIEE